VHAPGPKNALTDPTRHQARGRPFLLAALGGACCFLGYVGFGIWPCALVALALFWAGLEAIPQRRLPTAALVGFTFGWVAYAGGYLWMWRIVGVYLHGNVFLGAALWVTYGCWFGLRFVLCALLYCLVRRRRWPVAAASIAPLVVVEWLYPSLFPVYLGHALAKQTTLVQIADLGGPLLLTALLAAVNVAVLETWRWWRGTRRQPLWVWLSTGLALLLAFAYGRVRLGQIDREIAAAPALRVGVVQGNLGVLEKGRDASHDHHRYLEQTRELIAAGDVDLVVWPETVYTRGLRGPLPISGRLIAEDLRVPLLFGGAFVSGDSGRRLAFNAALLIGADGVIRSVYEKNLLIPFAEYIPFAAVTAASVEQWANLSPFAAATDTPPLVLGQWRIATPICYEAVRPAFVRRMVLRARPQLIVTLANDSWFGDSQEPWLHLEMAAARAVEHRRYLVRATNSGISAVIDPAGRVVARTGLLRRENLRATVHLLDGTSPYTRWGDWPGWLALVVLLAALSRPSRPDVSDSTQRSAEVTRGEARERGRAPSIVRGSACFAGCLASASPTQQKSEKAVAAAPHFGILPAE
jgi:apolipoprotein N-acyltransferase